MRHQAFIAAVVSVLSALVAPAARAQETETIECPATADSTVLAGNPSGRIANGGQLASLAACANRQFMLMNFDTSKLAGMEVVKATLRLAHRREFLVRVGLGTVSAPWGEGRSIDFEPCDGCACYQYAGYDKNPEKIRYWAWPGSDFGDVAFGNGGTRWVSTSARLSKDTTEYDIDVPPALVQALAQGLQPGGLCLADEFHREPAPTVGSRESANEPVLIVEARRVAKRESAPVTNVRVFRDAVGIEWVEFEAPRGLGFDIVAGTSPLSGTATPERVRRLDVWALPSPGTGKLRAMLSFLRESADTHVSVRTVEAAAEWSPWTAAPLPAAIKENPRLDAPRLQRFELPQRMDAPFTVDDGPALSQDGRWMRSTAKTWWDPYRGPVSLEAGRNEYVAFQVILAGASGKYQVAVADWKSPGDAAPAPRTALYRERYVKARLGQEKYGPEIAEPLAAGENIEVALDTWRDESPATQPASAPTGGPPAPPSTSQPTEPARADGSTATSKPTTQAASAPAKRAYVQGVWVELYVPRGTAPGLWKSRVVVVRDGAAVLDLPIELRVVEPTLPNKLNFAVSMGSQRPLAQISGAQANSAGTWTALDELYRSAHAHRVTFAYDPAHADGKLEPGFAPTMTAAGEAAQLDFDEWDRRFARYFDGSAFRDLPREGEPLDHFVLPFNENWPMIYNLVPAPAGAPLAAKYHYRATWGEIGTINQHRNPPLGTYVRWPIESAFANQYQEQTRRLTEQFVAHLRERGWKTEFHIAPSHEMTGTKEGSWWDLDRPQVMDDFLALRYWMGLYREGGATAGSPIKLRGTLAVPHFSRDVLDGKLDISTLDLSMFDKQWHLLAHPERYGRLWSMGWLIEPEFGWSVMQRWAWAARLSGAHGLALRESVGDAKAWDEARTEALLYPRSDGGKPPAPSLRLKALLRAQQDMEWIDQWRERTAASGTREGYYLSLLGSEMISRMGIRPGRNVNLLPVFEMPGHLDTVVFEELRRGLRAASR